MVDPVSAGVGTAVAKVAAGAKQDGLIKRIFGPPADVIGQTLARWVESRTRNVGRILENADRKLGDRREVAGEVPLRIGGRILEEGSYCDDPMTVEYLGGVLASSRSGVSRDDRGARWVSLVTSMSAYEIRLHYLLYQSARAALIKAGVQVRWGDESKYHEVRVLIHFSDIYRAMDFSGEEAEAAVDLLSEAMFALGREGLLSSWGLANRENLETQLHVQAPPDGGVWFQPTTTGIQLLTWAHGHGDAWRSWTDAAVELDAIECVAPRRACCGRPPETRCIANWWSSSLLSSADT